MEELGNRGLTISLFDEFPIRRTWHKGEWWFSCIDCVAPLSGSPNPNRYWSDFKRDLEAREGITTYALGVSRIPLPNQNGEMRKTDCANTEMLLRLIQSIPSPNAEPFKAWLARVGRLNLEARAEPELRMRYRVKLGHADASLHSLVAFRGISTPAQHQAVTDANYQGLYENHTQASLKDLRGIPEDEDERDFMGDEELGANIFQRTQAKALIERQGLRGEHDINQAAYDVGVEVRLTIQRLDGTMPEDLPVLPRLAPTPQIEG